MNGHWKFSEHSLLVIALLLCLVHQEFSFCCSLNDEGINPIISHHHHFASSFSLYSFQPWCIINILLVLAGLSLLRFRERVESDPFGALSNWKDGDGVENPCTWLGVGCFNGNVVSL